MIAVANDDPLLCLQRGRGGRPGYHSVSAGRSLSCMSCWDKVARGGREPREVLEAILIFNNDPDVGGPDDPLDHEDYRDLERLGLLSDSPG